MHSSPILQAAHAATQNSAKTAYSPDAFDIVRVGHEYSAEVSSILQSVRDAQAESERHFIKPQSLRDLFRHHALGLPVIASIERSSGKVAGVLLVTPSAAIYPNSPLDKYPSIAREADTAIIGSVATTPGFKGQMRPLLAAAESHAASMGLLGVWAKVSVANEISNKGFENAGWSRKIHGTDPDMGYKVSYWRKDLNGVVPDALPVFNDGHEFKRTADILSFAAPSHR